MSFPDMGTREVPHIPEATPTGDGEIVGPGIPGEALPERVERSDVELMEAFQLEVTTAQRAYATLMQHLSVRYQIQEGDRVTRDGLIERRAPWRPTPV